MKITHHEVVEQLVRDPGSTTGMSTQHIHRRSDVGTISFPRPKLDEAGNPKFGVLKDEKGKPIKDEETDEPVVGPIVDFETYTRGEDGLFDVPEDVGHHFTKGSTGHGQPGWSVWTGRDPWGAPDDPRIAALEKQVADLVAASKK